MAFAASSNEIRLETPAVLVATCRRRDGNLKLSRLDLNRHIWNREGGFDRDGHNFIASARAIRMVGTTLWAELSSSKGIWTHDTIDLNSIITNENGELRIVKDTTQNITHADTPQQPVGNTISPATNAVQQPKAKILCQLCQDWSVPDFREENGRFTRNIQIRQSDLSSKKRRKDCPSCHLAERIIRDLAPTLFKGRGFRPEDYKLVFHQRKLKSYTDACPYFQIQAENAGHKEEVVRCIIYTMPEHENTSRVFAHIRSAFHLRGESSPEETARIAKVWLEDCARRHDKCSKSVKGQMPTRVLDIGLTGNDSVKLKTTSGMSPAKYACLSHCWGKSNPLLLTKANHNDLHRDISLQSLQATYVDAIELTRKLGIRYLWIDTLCITQDSSEDWKKESSMMHAYYGNCFVCIAATSAASHDGGCRIRDMTIKHQGRGDDDLPYSVFVRPYIPHISYSSMYPHQRFFPLLTRAWVYQERRLSPRVLHVTDAELFFECTSTTHCECSNSDDGNYTVSAWTKAEETYFASHHRVNEMSDGPLKGEHEWRAHVHAYSTLNITKQTDRLPALGGLAQWMCSRRQQVGSDPGRYLAGCWEKSLIDDISWVVGHELTRYKKNKGGSFQGIPGVMKAAGNSRLTRPRPAERVAPSWSWASTLEPVNFAPFTYTEALCHVEDANVELATKDGDVYGQVKSGHLLLRAKVRPSRWASKSAFFNGYQFYLTDIKGTQNTLLGLRSDKGLQFWRDWCDGDTDRLDSNDRLYLMPLASRKIWSNGDEAEFSVKWMPGMLTVTETAYLVLRIVQSESRTQGVGVFERVGWASYSGLMGGPDFGGVDVGYVKLI